MIQYRRHRPMRHDKLKGLAKYKLAYWTVMILFNYGIGQGEVEFSVIEVANILRGYGHLYRYHTPDCIAVELRRLGGITLQRYKIEVNLDRDRMRFI